MRLPGAALLITIGLFILWLASTGNLKKIGAAWDFIRGTTDKLPTSGVGNSTVTGAGIHDYSNFHVETHLAQPIFSYANPGGLN